VESDEKIKLLLEKRQIITTFIKLKKIKKIAGELERFP